MISDAFQYHTRLVLLNDPEKETIGLVQQKLYIRQRNTTVVLEFLSVWLVARHYERIVKQRKSLYIIYLFQNYVVIRPDYGFWRLLHIVTLE